MVMATDSDADTVEELEAHVEELQQRVEALEGIFSERLLDREGAHIQATQQDAREQLEVGETHRVVVDSPPGTGRDPSKAVGRIEGIVTFIEPKGLDIEENDVLKVRLKQIQRNCVKANTLEIP